MRLVRLLIWLLVATIVVMRSEVSIADDMLDESRAKFLKAYKDMRYDQLCDVLDKDASFRGKVFPGKWSHTSDQIITDRWKSKLTCTEIGQNPKSERQQGDNFTVGQAYLELKPSRAASFVGNQRPRNYAIDFGDFRMKAMEPQGKDLVGSYVMLWKRDGKSWKLMHIDMSPEGAGEAKK